MSEMTTTPNPPVNTGDAPDVPRPQPADPPGSPAGGWSKIGAVTDGGWSVIDDVEGADAAGWQET
jgi:hypothetical protein